MSSRSSSSAAGSSASSAASSASSAASGSSAASTAKSSSAAATSIQTGSVRPAAGSVRPPTGSVRSQPPNPNRPALPGDIKTEPAAGVVYNAPCCFDQKTSVRFTNLGDKKIGWQVRCNKPDRYGIEPANGVLKPQANAVIEVKCRSFMFKPEDCQDDWVTFEWVEVPADEIGEEVFNPLWFSKSLIFRRHNLLLRYNV